MFCISFFIILFWVKCWSNNVLFILNREFAIGIVLAPGVARAEEPEALVPDLSGIYEVKGLTVQADHGRARPVTGTLELRLEDDKYVSEFDFETIYPVAEKAVSVTIDGAGRGVLVGRRMAGISSAILQFDTVLGHDHEGEEDA